MVDRPRTQNGSPRAPPRTAPASTAPDVPAPPARAAPDGLPRLRDTADLLVAVALVVVAALARLMPEENTLRLLLTLPVLLFVPGYLLIQMFVPLARSGHDRTVQALVALGASLPVVGLLALSTAVVPGGFRPTPIVVVTTGACILFAVVAYLRRWLVPPAPEAEPVGATA